jgi:ATP-dependent protease ClpP protease subunit
MEFEATPPDFATLLRDGYGWDIFATGEIDLQAGENLERLLAQKSIPNGSQMHIHSPGGSLVGGMNLGRVIRSHNLNTDIAKKGKFENGFQHTEDGYCMSAAALAFLGGEFRFARATSKFGVHRFTLGEPSAHGIGDAQLLSASVVEYIRSMEVDTELFSIASDCPADDLLELPLATMKRLCVVNNGIKAAKWTIESIEGALYLKGERDTFYGMQKFLLIFPSQERMYFHIIFDGGQNTDEIMQRNVDRLSIDGEYFALHELRIKRVNDHRRINAMYHVTPEILIRLRTAKTIGYHLQHFADSAMFVGYDSLPFEEGAAKLPGLLDVYFREPDPNERSLRPEPRS